MRILCVDLKPQYHKIKAQLRQTIEKVLEAGMFVGG